MSRVQRFDRSTVPPSKVQKLPSGGIKVDGAPTRAGVFLYDLTDGTKRREYRAPEEVFSEDSLATLADAAVTIGHPEESISPATWARDSVGHVGAPRVEAPHVAAPIVVQRGDAIEKVGARDLVELSCGYSCGLDMTPGTTPEGEHYDARQIGIVYNHVALLPKGEARGGPTVALRLDSGACISSDMPAPDTSKDDEIKALRERADKAEAKIKDLEASIPARVAARSGVIAKAIGWGVIKADEATSAPADDDTIIRGILKKAMPALGKSLDMMTHEILMSLLQDVAGAAPAEEPKPADKPADAPATSCNCLLYTSDAADE